MTLEKLGEFLNECEREKPKWGSGPWQYEPDRLDFKRAGFDCMVLRNPHTGVLCGYVGVPKSNPLFGTSYQLVDERVEVHGGLTYSSECRGPICHIADDDDPIWWFGFDTAHALDYCPALEMTLHKAFSDKRAPIETYRDINYVRSQTEKLADQLVKL